MGDAGHHGFVIRKNKENYEEQGYDVGFIVEDGKVEWIFYYINTGLISNADEIEGFLEAMSESAFRCIKVIHKIRDKKKLTWNDKLRIKK